MIDEIWNNRTLEDFDKRGSQVKLDFMRFVGTQPFQEKAVIHRAACRGCRRNSIDFDIPDTRSAFENSVLSELQIAEFAAGLSERDKKILEMKMKGR